MRSPHQTLLALALCAVACADDDTDRADPFPQPPSRPVEVTEVTDSEASEGGCSFDVTYELSPTINTVGIVQWSTDSDVEQAHIGFAPVGSRLTLTAPVDLDQPSNRTLLLGMKGSRDYTFQIHTEGTAGPCISAEFTLTTGPVPNSVPVLRQKVYSWGVAGGFVVTSAGLGNLGTFTTTDDPMFIFDRDGDVVWYWPETPTGTSRARMSWDGQHMWMMANNVLGGAGRVSRVSMDGLDFEANVDELKDGHHDFTVLPGGITTAIIHDGDCSAIVERAADGSIRKIVPDVSDLYEPGDSFFGTGRECHPNSILFHPEDDTYTVSDRNTNSYVAFTRGGDLLWQLGGSDPRGNHFEHRWTVNHGHHMPDPNTFLLFANGNGSDSRVIELSLDQDEWEAESVWEFEDALGSATLGDVQRLPNGNTLITYSNAGVLLEVNEAGETVRRVSTDSLGYAMWRPTLYGPPPK